MRAEPSPTSPAKPIEPDPPVGHRIQVRLERAVELLGGDFENIRLVGLLTRVVHQAVEPTQLGGGLLDETLAERLIRNVAGEQDRLAAVCLDQLCHNLGIGFFYRKETETSGYHGVGCASPALVMRLRELD